MTAREKILSLMQNRPWISAELHDELEKSGFSRGQSKTAVSRLIKEGKIVRSTLRLGHGVTILLGVPPVLDKALTKTLIANEFFGRPSLINLKECVLTSHPEMSRFDVAKIAALEIGDHQYADWNETEELIRGLQEIGILETSVPDHAWRAGETLLAAEGSSVATENLKPGFIAFRDKVRSKIASTITEWLRINCFVSHGGAVRFDIENRPQIAYLSIPFDFLGFSYAKGIARWTKGQLKPTPVVGDILLRECNEFYVRSFQKRVAQSSVKGKITPVCFILAKVFTTKAFLQLKQANILGWTQSQLLGEKAAEAIFKTLQIAETMVHQQNVEPQIFQEAFEGFKNAGSLFGDLKGDLLELLIGYIFQKRGYEVHLAWELAEPSEKFEVDVVGFQNVEASIVECKGIKDGKLLPSVEVDKHFKRRTQAMRTRLLHNESRKVRRVDRFRSYVITTGAFEPKSMNDLNANAFGTRDDTVFELWDRKRLIEELRNDGHSALLDIINRYYAAS